MSTTHKTAKSYFSELLAGATASGIVTTLQTPYERVKLVNQFVTRVAQLRSERRSIWKEFRNLWYIFSIIFEARSNRFAGKEICETFANSFLDKQLTFHYIHISPITFHPASLSGKMRSADSEPAQPPVLLAF